MCPLASLRSTAGVGFPSPFEFPKLTLERSEGAAVYGENSSEIYSNALEMADSSR